MDVLFPPGPQKSLLFGDAPQFKSNPFEFMAQAARAYGDLVHFRFGPSHAYLLTNPRDAHRVLVEHHDQFFEKPSLLRALNSAMGHDLFAPSDQVTKQALRRGLFKSDWLTPFIEDAAQASSQMLDLWQGGDPLPLLREITLRVVTQTLFGQTDDRAGLLAEAITVCRDDQAFQSPLTLPLWVPTASNRQKQRAQHEIEGLTRQLIAAYRQRGCYGILSCLLNAADRPAWAVEELLALFYAGYEATARTLAWSWYLLTQYPDAAESLQAEVDTVLGGRTPTGADLPNLVYCAMVFKETLRLYPPVWLIRRQAKKETRLGEYYVPAGSTIFVSPYITHRSQRYYTAPDRFLPERFGDSFARRGSNTSYMPFGAGTYSEVEHSYATAIGTLILALSAQKLHLSLKQKPETGTLTAAPNGLQLHAEHLVTV
ncbi:MAG TPA: cytochrome P450 [Phototrophicaceae bacterium]|nr:cytochrome P450 [Phototrophicaceae bacterium]